MATEARALASRAQKEGSSNMYFKSKQGSPTSVILESSILSPSSSSSGSMEHSVSAAKLKGTSSSADSAGVSSRKLPNSKAAEDCSVLRHSGTNAKAESSRGVPRPLPKPDGRRYSEGSGFHTFKISSEFNEHELASEMDLQENNELILPSRSRTADKSGSSSRFLTSPSSAMARTSNSGNNGALKAAAVAAGRFSPRYVPGQLMKQAPPSKWDDAEKWLMNSSDSPSHHHSQPGRKSMGSIQQASRSIGMVGCSDRIWSNLDHIATPHREFTVTSPLSPDRRKRNQGPSPSPSPSPSQSPIHGDSSKEHGIPSEKCSTSPRASTDCLLGSSSELFPTDKYADTVVRNKDEFLVHTPKHQSMMKDACTDVIPPVLHRDMGTQMTPFSSSRPSRCATPVKNTSPARHNTPAKRSDSPLDVIELQSCHLAKLQHRQIPLPADATSTPLDRASSNCWSTREEEDEESSKSLRHLDLSELRKSVVEARAAAWEEAEEAKCIAKFKREETKIQAWENEHSAKAEADMRKLEMKVEKIRAHGRDKIMSKLEAAQRRAQEMRASAIAQQQEQLAKTKQRALQMRRTGHLPSHCFSCTA